MFDVKSAPQASKEQTKLKISANGNELMILDDIGKDFMGNGISAADVTDFLKSRSGDQVTAHFNSFGGDAFEGIVIHNAFVEHGDVTAVIDGIAFSAAAIAASGAGKLIMNEASSFGVHRSWTVAAGNQNQLRAAIDWLDTVDEHQISVFSSKTGASRDQIIQWLDGPGDGTVFSAAQALENGFADEVIPIKKQQAAAAKAAGYSYARQLAKLRHLQIN